MLEIDIKLLPFQGVTNERALTQGVALLALGFACPGLCAPLGFQPALAKSESIVFYSQTTLSRVFGAASRQETLPLHTYD